VVSLYSLRGGISKLKIRKKQQDYRVKRDRKKNKNLVAEVTENKDIDF
jgi:hypothetical protein